MKRILIEMIRPKEEVLLGNNHSFIKIIAIEEMSEINLLEKQTEFFLSAIDTEEWPKMLKKQELSHVLLVEGMVHGGVWTCYSQESLVIDIIFAHGLNRRFNRYIQEFLEEELLMNILFKDYKKYLLIDDVKLQDILGNLPVYNNHNYFHFIEYSKIELLENKGFSTLLRVRFEINLDFLE